MSKRPFDAVTPEGPTVNDTKVTQYCALASPQKVLEDVPTTAELSAFVSSQREQVVKILSGEDKRLLVITGPCSLHDEKAAMEYARKLAETAEQHKEHLFILMRAYFEKPRTTIGWKGLVYDPDLNGSYRVNKGLRMARRILRDVNSLGLGCACEFLDTMTPQYFSDLVAFGFVGARTVECQLHRNMCSGLSMPIGFKNGTSGNIQVAVDACKAAKEPTHFLGMTKQGAIAVVHSKGNQDLAVVLRGGTESGPNYAEEKVREACEILDKAGLDVPLVIDVSHGNSQKQHANQPLVLEKVCEQVSSGNDRIRAVMIESHLSEGSQAIPTREACPPKCPCVRSASQCPLIADHFQYGVSITDSCVSWETNLEMIQAAATASSQRASSS